MRLEDLFSYIMTEPNSGCWFWLGKTYWEGKNRTHEYGTIRFQGTTWFAHNFVYCLLRADFNPALIRHHKCRITICVNPDHLDQMTRSTHSRLHNREQDPAANWIVQNIDKYKWF